MEITFCAASAEGNKRKKQYRRICFIQRSVGKKKAGLAKRLIVIY